MKASVERLKKFKDHAMKIRKKIERARSMKEAGYSNVEIADQLGINENAVRNLLKKS